VAVQAVLGRLQQAGAQVVPWQSLHSKPALAWPTLSAQAVRSSALALLPRARTRLAVKVLLRQAEGAWSKALKTLERQLAEGEAQSPLLQRLLETAALGQALFSPPKVALAGPPNAGKSTLLNSLLHKERVIVDARPGTTRDVVRETISIQGVPFELMDSAGLGRTRGQVEQSAAQRAARILKDCDVVLIVFDVRRGLADALRRLPPLGPNARKILVGNKIDLLKSTPKAKGAPPELKSAPLLFISAREGLNLEQVEEALLAPYRVPLAACENGEAIVFSSSIREALECVAESLGSKGPAPALAELRRLSGARRDER
jgi:small GTP-binding protein